MIKLVKLAGPDFQPQAELVKKELNQGKIAILPTDTVYGLVCDGTNTGSKEKIYSLKGRPRKKPLIGFVPDLEQAEKYSRIPPEFLPLIRKNWPGAVTFILPARSDIPLLTTEKGEIGLRVPGYPFLAEVLKGIGILASTSANRSDEKAPASLEEIPRNLQEQVDLVVDGGPSPGRESTIWNITGPQARLVRGRVLFVCEGNSFRSPIAEHYLRKFLKDRGVRVEVASAGAGVITPSPIAEETISIMKEAGVEMRKVLSQPLTPRLAEAADLIFVMEEKQKGRILDFLPEAREKIINLDIPDPLGRDISFYRETRDRIKKKVAEIAQKNLG